MYRLQQQTLTYLNTNDCSHHVSNTTRTIRQTLIGLLEQQTLPLIRAQARGISIISFTRLHYLSFKTLTSMILKHHQLLFIINNHCSHAYHHFHRLSVVMHLSLSLFTEMNEALASSSI
jgi:hypothetical protein